MQERREAERRAMWPCLNVATWRKERSDRAIQQVCKPFIYNFFAVAAVADWNSMPETVVRCDNVNAFKKFRQTLGTQNVQHRVPCEKWTHMKELIDRGCGLQIRKEPVNKSSSNILAVTALKASNLNSAVWDQIFIFGCMNKHQIIIPQIGDIYYI